MPNVSGPLAGRWTIVACLGAAIAFAFAAAPLLPGTPLAWAKSAEAWAKSAEAWAKSADAAVAAAKSHQFGVLRKLQVAAIPVAREELRFLDPNGDTTNIAAFAGKPVLLNFWATWCAPCLAELPSINRLIDQLDEEGLSGAVQVIALNIDRKPEKPLKVLSKDENANLAFFRDPTVKIQRDAALRGMPTTLILDGQGREIARYEGDAHWDAAEVVSLLRLLASVEKRAKAKGHL